MRELGVFLFFAGLIALVAPLLLPANFHFPLLDWMNTWGTAVGWAIKGGLTVLGLVLWLRSKNRD